VTAAVAEEEVRVLSIRQPWAALILAGVKTVENRTWTTRWRGRILIHTGKRDDLDGLLHRIYAGLLPQHVLTHLRPYDQRCPHGGYVGTAVLTDTHPARAGCCGPWAEPDRYHWRFTDPQPFPAVVAAPGGRGLYRPPADAAALLADTATTAVVPGEG
jgi:hypothetical protein